MAHKGESNSVCRLFQTLKKPYRQSKLTASRFLRVKKVANYVG